MDNRDGKKDKHMEISCNIVEKFGYLNESETKIFAKVSWSEKEPKYDIRKCYTPANGELKLAAGISLTESEMDMLVSLYQASRSKEVKLDEVFASATSIMEKRENGYRTEDGFIRLHPKRNI